MRRFGLAVAISCTSITASCMISVTAFATDSHIIAALRRLDPATRFEQACDSEAMTRIRKERASYRPDRAVADAITNTKVTGDTMQGSGAAFRSGGKWYRYSFTCKTSRDRLKVMSFSYKIGSAIPEREWDEYGLWR